MRRRWSSQRASATSSCKTLFSQTITNAFSTDQPFNRSLQHKFGVELKDGTRQTRTSTLIEYGSTDPAGYSAMAKLVGVPCAVAVQQVLNGTLSEKGILAPMNGKINGPLIKELKEKYGIFCKEEII